MYDIKNISIRLARMGTYYSICEDVTQMLGDCAQFWA